MKSCRMGALVSGQGGWPDSKNAWYAWSAVLAAVPYVTWDVAGRVIPGQLGTEALSVAFGLVLVGSILASSLGGAHGVLIARTRRIMVRVGRLACVVLVVVEAASVARGFPLYTEEQIALNNALSLVEFVCSTLAVCGWALWPTAKVSADASRSTLRLLVAFAVGGAWPTASVLLSDLVGSAYPPGSLVLCALAGLGAFYALRQWYEHNEILAQETTLLLAGQLAFCAIKDIARENSVTPPLAWIPEETLYGGFLAFLGIFVTVLLVRTQRNTSTGVTDEKSSEGPEANVKVCLAARADKALTEREMVILARTALGEGAKDIADDLGIAEPTVASYRRRGYEKTDFDGARELRRWASTLEVEKKGPSAQSECVDSVPGRQKDKQNSTLTHVFVIVLLLVLAYCPSTIKVRGTTPYTDTIGDMHIYYACAVEVGFVFVGTVRLALSGDKIYESEDGEREKYVYGFLSPLCLALLMAGIYCSWEGFHVYRTIVPVALLLWSCAVSRWEDSRRTGNRGVSRFFHTLARGFNRLFLGNRLLVFFAAACLCAVSSQDFIIWAPLLDWLPLFYVSTSVGMLIVLTCRLRNPIMLLSPKAPKQGEETSLYLQGHGMGNLQVAILRDLIAGAGVREACEKNNTTRATVKSYRQRAYEKLDVHSMAELRRLLSRETNFTGNKKVHPPK